MFPVNVPTFIHERPVIDMRHGATGGARWGSYNGFDAIEVDVGTAQDPMGKSVPWSPLRLEYRYRRLLLHGHVLPGVLPGQVLPRRVESRVDQGLRDRRER